MLVLGMCQLFADNVTFSVSDLRSALPSGNTNISLPYSWKTAPYHVSVDIANQDGTGGSLSVTSPFSIPTTCQFTVSVAGKGTLDKIKISTNPASQTANVSASTGTYTSPSWVPNGETNSVTFTVNGTFRLTQIYVEYTPDDSYTPVDPNAGTEPIEATPIESLSSYSGKDPFVYDKKALKYYALNSLDEYEEYGVYTEVKALKAAGAGVSEIEYLKSPNGAYINLNYIPKANSKAICTMVAETGGDWKAAYGCGYNQNGWKDRFCFFTTNGAINLGGETIKKDNMVFNEKIVTVLDAVAGKLDIFAADGETLLNTITDSPKTADCKTPLYVFAQNKDIPDGNTQTDCYNPFVTIYGLQLYEGETLVMDLVPAVNGEGKGGLKDKLTGTFYGSANSAEFELSPDGQTIAGAAGVPVYEGKMVIYNGNQYEYTNGNFVDKGALTYSPVTGLATDYRNLSNWKYPSATYDSTFGVNVYNAETGGNTLSPYEGKGGWEPLSFKLEGLTKGETYRASFNYTGTAWHSWSSYTTLPFFVLDNENMPGDSFNNPDAALGYIALPNTETTDQAYSTAFVANHTYALLCIQFGVVDDGSHDPAFAFSFNDIKVEKQVFPVAYRDITWADPVKYTELAYIESTGASRENAFTLPYNPITATQIDTKFQVYDTSSGWCGIFSARNTYAGTGISLYMNGNDRAHFGYFTGGTTGGGDNFAPFSLNTDYEVTADVTKLVVNGEEYPTGNSVTNATTRNLSLFANPEWDNPMRGRFYYCKISEGGEVIYNFKPVMRHDGVFGFYDKASKVFVQPAQGKLDGYGFKKLDDQAYLTYNKDTRIVIVGTTAQFLPDVQNLDGAAFTWTSSDESKATVAADGTVTGKAAGKVTITVTTDADQGWTASYELTVSEPDYKRFDAENVGYAIIAGGNGWGDSPLSALLDNNATTKFGTSNVGEAWAIIVASEPVAVKQYSIVTGGDTYNYPSRNPVSWKLEGSNDNQNWTLVDEKVQTYQLQAKNKEEFAFPVNGTEKYKFFKFSATQLADGFQMGEFWINAQAYTWGEPTETAATCSKLGEKVTECTTSHVLKTEVLPLAAHAYEKGVCTVCGAKASEVVLLPTRGTDNTPYYAKYRHANKVSEDEYVDIEEGWTNADFDDSAWDELMMPLGSFGPYHTRWFGEYNTFWFRRDFYIENPATITKLTLKATHDDDCAVFINGKKVWAEFNWTGGENDWRTIDVDPALLVAGKNVLAMYIEQNFGGAYCDFGLEAQVGATIEVSDAGYATFVAPIDVDFTGAAIAANAAKFDGTYVQLAPVTTVPAGTAVVVKAEEGKYTVPATTDAVLGADNELKAATAEVTTNGAQYILAKVDGKVGFFKATGTIAAGKGYLELSNAVKAFYPFFGEEETGINSLTPALSEGEGAIYNVAGQRVSKLQKGINIVNGKKILK